MEIKAWIQEELTTASCVCVRFSSYSALRARFWAALMWQVMSSSTNVVDSSSPGDVPFGRWRLNASFCISFKDKIIASALIFSTPSVRPTKFSRRVAAMKSSSSGLRTGMLMYSCWPAVSSSSLRLRSTAWIRVAVDETMILERRAGVSSGWRQWV